MSAPPVLPQVRPALRTGRTGKHLGSGCFPVLRTHRDAPGSTWGKAEAEDEPANHPYRCPGCDRMSTIHPCFPGCHLNETQKESLKWP